MNRGGGIKIEITGSSLGLWGCGDNPGLEGGCMIDSNEAEGLVYRWCTREARGSHSARALAAIYASTYMDEARMLQFIDLKVLDDTRFEWAMALIQGYVEGTLVVPWPRAVALVALYELIPEEFEIEPEYEAGMLDETNPQ